MRRTNKKGFTIVELVIVIAVIAILAAVLIPTFASLVNKANQSADIQAVRQMNTILATYTDGSIENVRDAIEALDKENIDLENYTPMTKNTYFYFYIDNGTPKIVYMDQGGNAIYPTDAKTSGAQLMSLSGDTPTDSSWYDEKNVDDGTAKVSIANGAQMADLMNNINKLTANTEIKKIEIALTNDINMMGSNASFGTVTTEIVLNGDSHAISGLRVDRNSTAGSWKNEAKEYGYGLFNDVQSNVTVSNLTIKDFVIGNSDHTGKKYGHSAVLFGRIDKKATVIATDIVIDSCTVVGEDKAGSVVGYAAGGTTVSLTNVEVKNTAVSGTCWVATAIGYVDGEGKCSNNTLKQTNTVTFTNCNFTGVTVGVNKNETDWRRLWSSGGVPDKNWDEKDLTTADICTIDGNSYIPYLSGTTKVTSGLTTNEWYWNGSKHMKLTVNGTECCLSSFGSDNITPENSQE